MTVWFPVLVELLEAVRDWTDMPDVWVNQRQKVAAILEIAIAKAKGEPAPLKVSDALARAKGQKPCYFYSTFPLKK